MYIRLLAIGLLGLIASGCTTTGGGGSIFTAKDDIRHPHEQLLTGYKEPFIYISHDNVNDAPGDYKGIWGGTFSNNKVKTTTFEMVQDKQKKGNVYIITKDYQANLSDRDFMIDTGMYETSSMRSYRLKHGDVYTITGKAFQCGGGTAMTSVVSYHNGDTYFVSKTPFCLAGEAVGIKEYESNHLFYMDQIRKETYGNRVAYVDLTGPTPNFKLEPIEDAFKKGDPSNSLKPRALAGLNFVDAYKLLGTNHTTPNVRGSQTSTTSASKPSQPKRFKGLQSVDLISTHSNMESEVEMGVTKINLMED